MKRIIILCDGTWNRSDSHTPTNVVQLAQAIEPIDPVGIQQIPIYIQGVGTGEGNTHLSRRLDAVLGGAFGWGLLENIEEAYRHLVFLYEPGDEIYIFGFSRGAYTARSLTGFMRSTGIVNRDALDRIPEAIARYRTLDAPERTHPGSDASHDFRAGLSPRVVTSPKEAAWRQARDLPEAHLLRIAFLGVWDSVGALGVPGHVPLLGRWTKRKYRFHDADLSSMVRAARHAVAIDERRRAFEPTRWSNVAELNAEADDPSARPYREFFFLGDHGSVGGGGDIEDLSSIALSWMMEGADAAGLALNARRWQSIRMAGNPMGPLANRREPARGLADWITRLGPKDRKGPDSIEDLHPSVLDRWALEGKADGFRPYRPGPLLALADDITAHHATRIAMATPPEPRSVVPTSPEPAHA